MNKGFSSYLLIIIFVILMNVQMYPHCDTMIGPVIKDARKAIETKNIAPVVKWIKIEHEKEIRSLFKKTLIVRSKGEDAQQLADMYFFENLVRIHRAGEGAPYTGLKSGTHIDPAVALADKALENGSVDQLVNVLTKAISAEIKKRFNQTYDSGKNSEDSAASGRKFVESYVGFTHFVEGLHNFLKKGNNHHTEKSGNKDEHEH